MELKLMFLTESSKPLETEDREMSSHCGWGMALHGGFVLGTAFEDNTVEDGFEDNNVDWGEVAVVDVDGAREGVEHTAGPQTGPHIWDGINGESSKPTMMPTGPTLYSPGSMNETEPSLSSKLIHIKEHESSSNINCPPNSSALFRCSTTLLPAAQRQCGNNTNRVLNGVDESEMGVTKYVTAVKLVVAS